MTKKRALGFGGLVLFILLGITLYQPEWLFKVLEKQSSKVIYSVNIQKPIVAISIDDGPDPGTTSLILDILKQHEVRATFFLISSNVPGNESVVSRIVDEGHELGNHLTVDKPSISYSPAEFEDELLKAHTQLSEFGTIRWFRPGSGWYNTAMLSILEENNYRAALASVYPFDVIIPSPFFASRYILWRIRPGSIVLLHDNGSRGERTAKTLAFVLPELKRRGFSFATLSELVELEE